jgi:hypothetical protein
MAAGRFVARRARRAPGAGLAGLAWSSVRPGPTLDRRMAAAMARLQLAVRLLQRGAGRLSARSPWLGLPVATAGLALLWPAFWLVWAPALACLPLAPLLRPTELALRRAVRQG